MKVEASLRRPLRRLLVVNALTVFAYLVAEASLVRLGASLAVFARPGAPLIATASLAGVVLSLRVFVLVVVPARLALALSRRVVREAQPPRAPTTFRPPAELVERRPS